MFDDMLQGPEALADVDDTTLVAAITGWARVEAAAAARRLAAIAELVHRRGDGATDCSRWSCDNWDAMAAEVAAASDISHGIASGQMYLAVALRNRLPRVGTLFADGMISARLAATIAWHTALINDPETMQLVDKALAEDAAVFGPMSINKTAQAIDTLIDRYDPAAVRRTRAASRGRDVVIAPDECQSDIAHLWGSLFATDAAVLDRRLTAMADQVCEDDPRTLAQRRADALGALAAGSETLACGCGATDCSAAAIRDARASSVIVHVVAEESSLDAQPDPNLSGEPPPRPPSTPDTPLHELLAPDPEPDLPAVKAPSARIVGGGSVPAPLLAELIRAGATVTPIHHPGDTAAEPGYRPSAALARFIRCRDLTCRFPGCDRPAQHCDIDHAIAWHAGGPTHPSNLRCLCRKHHLLKTFFTGATGWRDKQESDGTIVWTAPSGHTYTTRPGSRLLYPSLCTPTGQLPIATTTEHPHGQRGIMMPTRKRTREQDRAYHIDAERAHNAAHLTERNKPPPF
jgi:hypothetical protein